MDKNNEQLIPITNYTVLSLSEQQFCSRWMPIIKTLMEMGEENATIWLEEFMALPGEKICGIKGTIDGASYSIISHKYSYGGNKKLFEVMPGIGDDFNDVTGWLDTEDVVLYLKEKMFKGEI